MRAWRHVRNPVYRKRSGAVIVRGATPIMAAIAIAFAAVPAAAAVIFDNGAAIPGGSPFSDHDRWQEIADDFVLAQGASTIRGVSWTGDYGSVGLSDPPANEIFAIRIFADVAGLPSNAAPLHDFTVTNHIRTVSAAVSYRFDFVAGIPEVTLTAGTTYWLSIVNITEPFEQSDSFSWSITGVGDGAVRSTFIDVDPWGELAFQGEGRGVAFRLLDEAPAVPAPSGLAVLAGAALFAFIRRRDAG